jgi:capsid protein
VARAAAVVDSELPPPAAQGLAAPGRAGRRRAGHPASSSTLTDPSKFEAVLFKPRGWSWIDPTKEVEAYGGEKGRLHHERRDRADRGGRDIEDVSTRASAN